MSRIKLMKCSYNSGISPGNPYARINSLESRRITNNGIKFSFSERVFRVIVIERCEFSADEW